MFKITRGALAVVAFLSIPLAWADSPEVRVLIDVSGSMKQNDPANLRVPALRLLTELLPEDATAGVWLFAQAPDILIPSATADTGWKEKAAAAAERVHSRGLLTDIEAALGAATRGWQPAAQEPRRHIILLTDGVVDTDSDAQISAASRARILADQVPRLQKLKASVHTIALSGEADHELLRALAESTDGWYESVSTARDLQRTFLRMFEQAAPREGLPLEGNKFTVDSSISELTVLAFSSNPDEPVRLGQPDGAINSKGDHPETMRWRREAGYELITISDPAPGEWQLYADMDPDNRVLIVTDLKMQVSDIPTNMLNGESSEIATSFVDGDKPIERTDFLELTEVTVNWTESAGEGGEGVARLALEDRRAEFVGVIGESLAPGRYTLGVRADAETFSREKRFSLEIHDNPLRLELAQPRGDEHGGVVALLTNPDVMPIKRVLALAEVESTDGLIRVLRADDSLEAADRLQFVLDPDVPGTQLVTVTATTRSASGRIQTVTLPSLEVLGTDEEVVVETPDREVAAEIEPEALEESDGEFDYLLAGMVIGGSNLGLFGLLAGGRLIYRKPRKNVSDSDAMELFDVDPDDA